MTNRKRHRRSNYGRNLCRSYGFPTTTSNRNHTRSIRRWLWSMGVGRPEIPHVITVTAVDWEAREITIKRTPLEQLEKLEAKETDKL